MWNSEIVNLEGFGVHFCYGVITIESDVNETVGADFNTIRAGPRVYVSDITGRWIQARHRAGALGGKLLGAGGRGFLLVYANPDLLSPFVSEVIRYQTPVAHMRRTAKSDVDFHGHSIKKGDKVIMWYLSGNRDESIFPDADRLIIDRENARQHVSFGFGVHRCMGNRLAEMQLRVLWEEIQNRFRKVEVVGEIKRLPNNFIRGISDVPVLLHPY